MRDDQGEHTPLCEGEDIEQNTLRSAMTIPQKRPPEEDIDNREPQKAQGVQVDKDIDTEEPHKTRGV